MPVGRVSYLYLEPLSFEEFLDAIEEHDLRVYLQNFDWTLAIPRAIHLQLMRRIKEYLVIGGMPAVISAWITEQNPSVINQIQFDLLSTYRDDFAKYSGRLSIERLENIMNSIPLQLGKKFVYRNANSDTSAAPLKQALELLAKARICHRIMSTSANGLPLGAEVNEKFLKVIMLDCGLCAALLGLSLHQIRSVSEISMVNSGGMAEQLVGQLLRTLFPGYVLPAIYYWQRAKKGSDAEVDYIIQHEDQIIPIEVKAGSNGSLKSLHQFMKEKKKTIAIRINSDVPRKGSVRIKDLSGSFIEYNLLSLPFYLVEQLHRLLKSAEK